jgi:tetratricopeptide (TPR) repeat protein
MAERGGRSGGAALPALLQQAGAHYRAGRRREALALCRRILAAEPGRADVLALAGQIAGELGLDAEAVAHYAAAIGAKPDFAEAHYNLGNVLARLGRHEEAVAPYSRAAELRPELVAVHANLGNALHALGRWDEAAASYRRAIRLAPGAAEAHRNLGLALNAAGARDRALECFRRAVALKEDWPNALQSLANALMEGGLWREAISICDRWLRLAPANVEALGLKAVALEELGERDAARYLVDFDRLVEMIEFETPPNGFSDIAAFNAALARHALEHPTLQVPPRGDPRYHCATLRITDEFLAEPKGPAAAFERMIETAVSSYLQRLARLDAAHPFLVHPPRRWQLTSWAAVLDGEGTLDPHVHYAGYVSGVYYPKIPAPIGAPGQGEAGWFQFGGNPGRFPCTTQPDTRTIQPREGLMLLFPSYFYHRTLPFTAPESRVSIAFDAVPAA